MKCSKCGEECSEDTTQLCPKCLLYIFDIIKKDPEKFKKEIYREYPDIKIHRAGPNVTTNALRPQAQLTIVESKIDILCAKRNCCKSATNIYIPFEIFGTWQGERELIVHKCEHCGTETKVTITLSTEIINNTSEPAPKNNKRLSKNNSKNSNK